ncbi:MAG: PspC domain-containing protein, partial [Bifidobacteriaceae bacterium]|nr:PspC domain-containing protein [Bifidobacteriaceae bacterium]
MSTNPTPPTPSTGGGRAAFDNFITSVRRIGIWRTDDRWIGGVAAGIAHRLKVDPLLIRGAFVVTAILGGVGFLIYGLAWMLLPEAANGRIHLQEVSYGRVNAGFIGSAIATAIGVVGTFPFIGVTGGWGFVVVVLALVVVGLLVLPELARSPQTQGPGAPLGAQPQGPIPAGPNAGGPVGASTQANGPGATPWPGGTSPQANGPVAGPSPVGASTQANSPGAGPSPVGAST